MTDAELALTSLSIADTLRLICDETSRYERGVIDAELFAARVVDIIVRAEARLKSGMAAYLEDRS